MRALVRLALAVVVIGLGSSPAAAQFPERPIKLIVSAQAGAATDLLARIVADALKDSLGQPIIVENKPGASSMIAAGELAKAAPDGYTLMLSPNSLLIAPHMLRKGAAGNVDIVQDLVPVIETATSPLTLLAYPGLDVKSVSDLLKKARDGKDLSYASGGIGSALHLAGLLFEKATHTKMVHVPYKGLAGATTDVIAGRVDLMFGTSGGVMGTMISRGKLLALGVASKERSQLLPNVPTLQEQGVIGADLDAWFMMFAPAGTPQNILTRLNRETATILATQSIHDRFVKIGVLPVSGTLEQTADKFRTEYKRYGEIVAASGIGAK